MLKPSNGQERWRSQIAPSSARRGLFILRKIFSYLVLKVFSLLKNDGKINNKFGKKDLSDQKLGRTLVPPIVKDNEIIVAFRNSVASFSLPKGNLLWEKSLCVQEYGQEFHTMTKQKL